MNLRTLSIRLSTAVLLGIVAWLGRDGTIAAVFGILFLLPFYGFPPIVSISLSTHSKNPFSQLILAAASLLYGVWFAYAMYDAFYVNSDPQSGLIILAVGFAFLHVLFPLWLTAIVIEICHRIYYRKKNQKARTEP